VGEGDAMTRKRTIGIRNSASKPEAVRAVSAVPSLTPSTEWSELARRRRRGIVGRRGVLMRRAFVITDLFALIAAFLITEQIYGEEYPSWIDRVAGSTEYTVFFATLPIWLLILKLYGLYGRDAERTDHSSADDIVPVFHGVTVGVWLFQGAAWLTQLAQPKFPKLFVFWIIALCLAVAGRVVARQLCRRSPAYIQNAVIVGADASGQLIARKLVQHPEYGLNLLGFVDSRPVQVGPPIEQLPFLGRTAELPEIVRDRDVERVIVAGHVGGEDELELVHRLKRCDVQVDIISRLFEVMGPGVGMHKIESVLLLGLAPTRLSRTSLLLKRGIDLVVAATMLVVTAPLLAWIAWRIRRDSSGPIFFRQTRLGLNMGEFAMLKFRTMIVGTDQDSHREYIGQIMDKRVAPAASGLYKLDRTNEITPFGRWLRKTSLDELPQLINVLKGDMSLVGPRPCLPYELEHFEPHHYERFSVPAGLTGYWQVTARARSTYVEALDMDVAYARDWSLGFDFWLLARTPLLLMRKGTA
jgi:exopolysaccharide biosynthesis polyprenyl glycosylphosphotransferase